MLTRYGETGVVLGRPVGAPPVFTEVTCVAFVRGYRPDELVGEIQQGDREVRISNDEIAAASWPGPPRKGDRVTIDGKVWTVQAVDPRKVRETVAMHVITVRG